MCGLIVVSICIYYYIAIVVRIKDNSVISIRIIILLI